MTKKLLFLLVVFCLIFTLGCGGVRSVDTESTIVRKEVKDGNQYYFYVEYIAVIDGIEGSFTATIKLPNKAIYDRYEVGDKYVFKRPVPR